MYLSIPLINSPSSLLYQVDNSIQPDIILPTNIQVNANSEPFQAIFKFNGASTLKIMPVTIPAGQFVEGEISYNLVVNDLDSFTFIPTLAGSSVNWVIC